MFAVDFPYHSTDHAVEFFRSAPVSDIQRERIGSGKAARVLKIGISWMTAANASRFSCEPVELGP
jgi:hypothetical protein